MIIDLDQIIEAIESSTPGNENYLNTRTGEIILRSDEFTDEELNDVDNLLDDVWDDIVEIPSQRDADELGMMRDFVWDLPRTRDKETLKLALKSGPGAFRRFREAVKSVGLQNQWYEYRDQQYLDFARSWAKENELLFEEHPKLVYTHAGRQDMDLLVQLKRKELGLEDGMLDFEIERWIAGQMRLGNFHEIIALHDHQPVACGAVQWVFTAPTLENPGGKTGILCSFWCDPAFEKENPEKEIARRLLEDAKRKDRDHIFADSSIRPSLKQALQELGFQEVPVLEHR